MSTSKFVMAKKLHNVQKELMSQTFDEVSYDSLLLNVWEACFKEGLCFWFNFLEDACVLNLRDVEHENYELNIRLSYNHSSGNVKEDLLLNAFLITKDSLKLSTPKKDVDHSDEVGILSSDQTVPPHIREVIPIIESKGIPVTAEAIRNHLNLASMGNNARLKCNNYLKQLEESQ